MSTRLTAKNIGFFDSYRVWGGGEKWHDEVSRFMSAHRHDVTIFTPNDSELHRRVLGKVRTQDIEVEKLSYLNPHSQYIYYRKFKKFNLDTVVFNSFIDVRAAAVAAKKAGVKRTILRVGTPIAPKEKKSYLFAFKNGLDEIVGISKENLDCFYRDAPNLIKNKPTRIISNAIDAELFQPRPKEDNDIITFGNCCRLTDQKGLMDLMLISQKLKAEGIEHQVLLAGDGEEKAKLEAFCTENNLNQVKFLGHVEDTSGFYNSLDFLVFTSRFEGSARTILEAFACQIPVVAYHASSMRELIKDGEDGYYAEAFNWEDMYLKTKKMIDERDKIKSMGILGREKVVRDFNQQIIYKAWEEYLADR